VDSKRLERKLLRLVNKVRRDDTRLVLQFRPWPIFLMLSAVQFTRRNGQIHDPMVEELEGLEHFLSTVLLDACPWAADVLSLGNDTDLDMKPDGTPVDEAKFDAAVRRHMGGQKTDD